MLHEDPAFFRCRDWGNCGGFFPKDRRNFAITVIPLGFIESVFCRPDRPVRNPVVGSGLCAVGHDIHDPLQVDIPVGLLENLLPGKVSTEHAVVEVGINILRCRVDVNVLVHPFGRFRIKDIDPRQLADTEIVIAEPDPRVGHECPRLVLKGRESTEQVSLDKPGSGMVCADVARSGIGTLHGE